MGGRALHILYLAMIALATVACDISAILTDSGGRIAYATDIDPRMWRDVAIVDVPNHDTISRRDLSLFVRHQPQEKLDSLSMKLFTIAPDETIIEERFTIALDNSSHRRRNAAHLNEMTIHHDVVLRQKGDYKIYIFPQKPIKGIEAVGVSLIRNENKWEKIN